MGGAVRAVLGGGGQRRAVLGGRWSKEGGTGEAVNGGRYWGGGERRAVLGRR